MKISGRCGIKSFYFGPYGTSSFLPAEKGNKSSVQAENGRVSLIRPLYIMKSNRERRVHVKVVVSAFGFTATFSFKCDETSCTLQKAVKT